MPLFDFNNNITFENERVKIRPLVAEDYDLLAPIAFQDETLLAYSPSEIHTPTLLKGYIETALQAKANQIRYPFVIFDKKENRYAGSTSFGNVSNKNQRIEIGWTWIGRDFQGTGLNKSCKFLMMCYVFEALEFKRLEWKTDGRNIASRKAIQKVGGKYEGTLRSHTIMSDGYRRDTVYFGLLSDEWAEVKQTIFKDLL